MRSEAGRTPSAREARLARMEREHAEILARTGPTGTGVGRMAREARLQRMAADEDRRRYEAELAADRELDEARRYAIREP